MTYSKFAVNCFGSSREYIYYSRNGNSYNVIARVLFLIGYVEQLLNQKRNFRKIGHRGGHTRYERKRNRHLPQMKLKYQMKLMIFRLYMNFD